MSLLHNKNKMIGIYIYDNPTLLSQLRALLGSGVLRMYLHSFHTFLYMYPQLFAILDRVTYTQIEWQTHVLSWMLMTHP